MTSNKNRIPRKFAQITGIMQIKTSADEIGDKLHIYKNNCGSGYIALNTRTGLYAYMFADMLRNAQLFAITAIKL